MQKLPSSAVKPHSRPQLTQPDSESASLPPPSHAEVAALLQAAQDAVDEADTARATAERRENVLMQMLIDEKARVNALQEALDRERLRCEALAWKIVTQTEAARHDAPAGAALRSISSDSRR